MGNRAVTWATGLARDLLLLGLAIAIFIGMQVMLGSTISEELARWGRIGQVPILTLLGFHIGRVLIPATISWRTRWLLAGSAAVIVLLAYFVLLD